MAFKSYLTINGKIHGEVTGGVATGYATDALGSVTATVDGSGSVANTYRYKPYGATLSKTGTSADPKSQWVGSWGYRSTCRTQSESYIRARHYGQKSGLWTSVDPLWPSREGLLYTSNSPVFYTDSTGLYLDTSFAGTGGSGCSVNQSKYLESACKTMGKLLNKDASTDKALLNAIVSCVTKLGISNANNIVDESLKQMADLCKPSGPRVCVWCLNNDNDNKEFTLSGCENPCSRPDVGAMAIYPIKSPALIPNEYPKAQCTGIFTRDRKTANNKCNEYLAGKGCEASFILCNKEGGIGWRAEYNTPGAVFDILHELTHTVGPRGGDTHNVTKNDLVWAIQCCLCKSMIPRKEWMFTCSHSCQGFGSKWWDG